MDTGHRLEETEVNKTPDPGEVVRRQEAAAPTGRFTLPGEVADLVVLLASDRSANVTGSDFRIDGGLISTL